MLRRFIRLALTIAVIVLVMPVIAFAAAAAAAPAATFSIDLSSLFNYAVDIVATLLAGVGFWLIARVMKYLHLQNEDTIRGYLDEGLRNFVALGVAKLRAAGKDLTKVDVKNELVADVGNMAMLHFPDALTYFKLEAGGDALARMILARLPPA